MTTDRKEIDGWQYVRVTSSLVNAISELLEMQHDRIVEWHQKGCPGDDYLIEYLKLIDDTFLDGAQFKHCRAIYEGK